MCRFYKKKKETMGLVAFLFLAILGVMTSRVSGYAGGGWVNAHATFYGGGDASGTMGILPSLTRLLSFQKLTFDHNSYKSLKFVRFRRCLWVWKPL